MKNLEIKALLRQMNACGRLPNLLAAHESLPVAYLCLKDPRHLLWYRFRRATAIEERVRVTEPLIGVLGPFTDVLANEPLRREVGSVLDHVKKTAGFYDADRMNQDFFARMHPMLTASDASVAALEVLVCKYAGYLRSARSHQKTSLAGQCGVTVADTLIRLISIRDSLAEGQAMAVAVNTLRDAVPYFEIGELERLRSGVNPWADDQIKAPQR